ncbi:MAG: cytochrome c [Candidatus Tectomicrobia bacterium]
MNRFATMVLVTLSMASFGCSDNAGDQSQLTAAERGRKVYLSNCMPCHHDTPALPGAVGPAIAGSSLELVEARILYAAYPQGYTPKKPSRVMPALPHLKDEIKPLAAYLMAAETR